HSTVFICLFIFTSSGHLLDLHSFPTRRSSDLAGVLTRMQHGLLVATSPNAVTPQLLLAKIDEEIFFDQRTYYLGTNEYRDGTLRDRKSTRLNSSHLVISYAVFCLKKKTITLKI